MTSENDKELSPSRRKWLASADRREQLLDAAYACCNRSRDLYVPVDEIARESGVSRNLVYHYFGNQEALIEALLTRETKDFIERVERIPLTTPAETMHAIALEYLTSFSRHAANLKAAQASPRLKARITPQLTETRDLAAKRFAEALGLPFEGAVRSALIAGAKFMMKLARESGGKLLEDLDSAADLCVNVCRRAAWGAVRMEKYGPDRRTG